MHDQVTLVARAQAHVVAKLGVFMQRSTAAAMYVLEKDRRLAEAVASGEPLYCVQCGQRGCTSCPEPPYMDALRKVAYSQSSAVAAPRRMPVEPTEGPRHTREAPDAVPTSKAPSVDAVLAQVAPKRGPPQHIAELLNALEAEVLGGEACG